VCTTELSLAAKYAGEFAKRGVKLAAVSCDPVESHVAWTADVLAQEASKGLDKLPYPIIADPKRELAYSLGMLDAKAKDAAGLPLTARAVFVIGPDKKLKLCASSFWGGSLRAPPFPSGATDDAPWRGAQLYGCLGDGPSLLRRTDATAAVRGFAARPTPRPTPRDTDVPRPDVRPLLTITGGTAD